MSNRLNNETSPYLLQHAENPVNWYPWCEEAFKKSKEEDKPIFLSIGYSTCHWCHVMAHESFENKEIAALLNKHFISIKVDREERPDIDSIYMAVCQVFTGSGGWPTSIFMTPDQKPFFAGTYFPKNTRGGMVGLSELLTVIRENWDTNRDSLIQQAEQIISQLETPNTSKGIANTQLLDSAVDFYKKIYDKENGGFGRAPKFPTPHNLLFLLAYYERYRDFKCMEMVEHTLLQMYRGGLFDHIGYGFCRYSTDKKFLVPHFEKMLYDNALLILAYCKAYIYTKKPVYLEIAEKTASYILKEMTSLDGGFYSAQDADSDGEEGKYYLFTPDEIISILGQEEGEAFNQYFGINKEGNFEGKSIPNILHHTFLDNTFDTFLSKIDQYRKKRCSLHLDDKILTAWNSLMIAAMCELYRISKNNIYLIAAKKADQFIQDNLYENDTLFVSFRDGKRGVKGFLDDYAGYIFAQISLYEATLEQGYLSQAKRLCKKVISEFEDSANGGFYLYGNGNENLILRPKETYDGAIPSGNSLMAWNLVRLSQLTFDERYENKVIRQLNFLAEDATNYPSGHAMYLSALLDYYDPPSKLTVVLAQQSDKVNLPLVVSSNTVIVVLKKPTDEFSLKNGKTTFYICKNRSCLPPTNDLNELI